MRTTLDLDLDVLQAAKEIGATRGISAGQVRNVMQIMPDGATVEIRGETGEISVLT